MHGVAFEEEAIKFIDDIRVIVEDAFAALSSLRKLIMPSASMRRS